MVVRLHGSDALCVADNVLVPIAVTDELCVAAVLLRRNSPRGTPASVPQATPGA
jgi:hypothetical protein